MEHRARLRLRRRARRVHHGRGRLQGEVVRGLPRPRPLHLQRLRQQLVERAQQAPAARFPQVRLLPDVM